MWSPSAPGLCQEQQSDPRLPRDMDVTQELQARGSCTEGPGVSVWTVEQMGAIAAQGREGAKIVFSRWPQAPLTPTAKRC